MQVSVESSTGLERRLLVEIPAQHIEQEIQGRLKSLAGRVRLDGFRPGKVPFKVVVQKFGSQVRVEVCQEMAQSGFYRAVSEKNLRPAGQPMIELRPMEQGGALQFTATFEVYPEIAIGALDKIAISKPAVEVTEQDVDNMIEKLRKQRVEWQPVEQAAQKGDRIVLDFKGQIDGNDFPGNEGKDYAVVLGDNTMVPGFEDSLLGAKPGESRSFEVTFPEKYHHNELAGKRVQFQASVHAVSAPKLPEIDEGLIRSFGIQEGTVEAFRHEVKMTMLREVDQISKEKVKVQVMDGLLEHIAFDLPKALVEDEIERLKAQFRYDLASSGQQLTLADLPRELFEKQARRRVTLGLIIAEIIKHNQFKVEPQEVRQAVEALAATYENPPEVVQWYYASQDRLRGVEALVLEDHAVAWVLSQSKVTEQADSYDALVASRKN